MPVVEIPLSEPWNIRSGPQQALSPLSQSIQGAFRLDVMDEPYNNEICTRQRPAISFEDTTGISGTPQGITVFNNNIYTIVNNTFAQIGGTPTGANGTAWTTVTSTPGWAGRTYFDVVNLNGILFLVAGFTSGASTLTQADVWKSTDGG